MKWIVRGAVALLLAVVVLIGLAWTIPKERIARIAADRIEAATGRAVTIGGPVSATLWPRLGVRAEGIALANAAWSEAGPMLAAAAFEVGLSPAILLGGDLRIDSLAVEGARLVLERRTDGTGNWTFDVADAGDTSGGGTEPGSAMKGLAVGAATLADTEIVLIDHATARRIELRDVNLETGFAGPDMPVELAGTARIGERPVRFDARVDALAPLLDGGPTGLSAVLEGDATSLSFEGRLGLDPLSLAGAAEIASSDGFALFGSLGVTPPALPPGLGAARVDVAAAVTLAPEGTIHLRDIVAELDGNRITGRLDLDPAGERPRLAGALAADALAFPGAKAGGADSGEDDEGRSAEPIDASGLFALDAELTVETGTVAYGDVRIDALSAALALENGRAVLRLDPLRAYGGAVTGRVVLNGRGELSGRAVLDIAGLQLQPLLTDLAGQDRLSATADASIDLSSSGESVLALMAGLEGETSVRLGPGTFAGLDIAGMVRTRDLGYRGEGQRTVFDALSASFDVAQGVARGDDLTLDAPYLSATGAGAIDLGRQSLDYRLIPTLRAEDDGEGLSVPLLIDGPWHDPRVRPDLEYVARQRIEAVGDRAEDRVREKLAEELDLAPERLDSREAIEDAIRERVGDRLRGLLGDR
ncbi:AsmA family protein [uncultured Jannaschia sp.]|uniref:AsmA family protein n=1 Tax=uncultured Jannaschia sp. TaxID=293347 RepID=UPI00261A401B|nr:AsmA family protein [uncultured Jannaschia sp.]